MALADDLGNLILNLNPYTNDPSSGRGRSTGQMDIYLGNSNPTTPNPTGTINEVLTEMETDYPAEWTFKGQPQKVNTAIRVPYRYPVYGPAAAGSAPGTRGPLLYWVKDYLLIGFEGDGGGA